MSLLGMLRCVPVPAFMNFNWTAEGWIQIWLRSRPQESIAILTWDLIFATLSWMFYLSLGVRAAAFMFIFAGVMIFINGILETKELLLSISVSAFILAWIGQFIGHKIEGKKPAFFQDLLFLLIGPLWVLKKWKLRLT